MDSVDTAFNMEYSDSDGKREDLTNTQTHKFNGLHRFNQSHMPNEMTWSVVRLQNKRPVRLSSFPFHYHPRAVLFGCDSWNVFLLFFPISLLVLCALSLLLPDSTTRCAHSCYLLLSSNGMQSAHGALLFNKFYFHNISVLSFSRKKNFLPFIKFVNGNQWLRIL